MLTLAKAAPHGNCQCFENVNVRDPLSIQTSRYMNGNLHEISLLEDRRGCIVPVIPSTNIFYVNFTRKRNVVCFSTSNSMATVRTGTVQKGVLCVGPRLLRGF